MRTRALGALIATLLLAGTASAVTRASQDEAPQAVVTDPGDEDRTWDAGDPPDITTTTTEPTTSTAAPARSSARPRTSATTAPRASSPVAQTARVDQQGLWVVRRDGTGLRHVEATCRSDFRVWLSESELAVVRDGEQTPFRLRLDGSTSPFPTMQVTEPRTGQVIPLRGFGSLSPDRRMMAIQYGGMAYGVALVDLATGEATVIQSGDNPLPTWSPHGEILLIGPGGATLVGAQGAIRTTTPSPVDMAAPYLQWSPDGRRLVGAATQDLNSRVVFDPWSGASQVVPHLGPGGMNLAQWGDDDTLVIADNGVDHRIEPTVRSYDLTTGRERVLAESAHHPSASAASGLIAFSDSVTYRSLGVVSLDGSQRGELVTVSDGLWVSPTSWSPSGDLLLFSVCSDSRGSSGGLPST